MDAGDGRNPGTFQLSWPWLQNDFTVGKKPVSASTLLNKFVLKQPPSDDELEVILRDDAFQNLFSLGSTFLFDKFAVFMKNTAHVIKINGQLHIYKDGVCISNGYKRELNQTWFSTSPTWKVYSAGSSWLHGIGIVDEKNSQMQTWLLSTTVYIVLWTGELRTIQLGHCYYQQDPLGLQAGCLFWTGKRQKSIEQVGVWSRQSGALLEECIGYCFYRRNEVRQGVHPDGCDKSNGKSTFWIVVQSNPWWSNIYQHLTWKNWGTDSILQWCSANWQTLVMILVMISVQGSQVSVFKKIVTGNRIKAERKRTRPVWVQPVHQKLLFECQWYSPYEGQD